MDNKITKAEREKDEAKANVGEAKANVGEAKAALNVWVTANGLDFENPNFQYLKSEVDKCDANLKLCMENYNNLILVYNSLLNQKPPPGAIYFY